MIIFWPEILGFRQKLIFSLTIVALMFFGCTQVEKKTEKKPLPKGHVLSKKAAQDILRDVREDMRILSQIREDPAPLKKALAKKALEDLTTLIQKEVAEGKVKVRKFKNIKMELRNYSGGVAGVSLSYIDQSYYIDKAGNHLSAPTNAIQRYILAVEKIKGRWRIIAFYTPEVKNPPN